MTVRKEPLLQLKQQRGSEKGLSTPDSEYLKSQGERDDVSFWNVNGTFVRNHYSSIEHPDHWPSTEESWLRRPYLETQPISGKGIPAKAAGIEAEASGSGTGTRAAWR